jgi:hypothetical protein
VHVDDLGRRREAGFGLGVYLGPALTVSTVTVSPLAIVRTGFRVASKKPQWQVLPLAFR